MITRAAIYARVSSTAQRDAHTIENQLRTLPAFVTSQGWTLAATFTDDGRSAKAGKLGARDGFAALLRAVEARAFDVLVVVDVDRLTRTNDAQERAAILGPFQRAGIDIVTPSGGRLDLRTLMGELYVTMQALFAAEENRKRAERIRAGKARAIAEGRKPAGPTPFGLAYDRATGAWSIDALNAAIVIEMFRRVAGGESCEAIAADLEARGLSRPRGGQWIRERVWQIVTSRTYVGEWTADKAHALVLAVPAIVDEALWQRTQAALESHGRRGLRRVKHVYLLERIAVCGACGAPMGIRSGVRRGTNYSASAAAYMCSQRRRPPRGVIPCMAAITPIADADARVWEAVRRELEDPDLVPAIVALEERSAGEQRDWSGDAAAARAHLARLARVETGVLARYRGGSISEVALDAELGQLRREREMVREQLATAERAVAGLQGAQERTAQLQATIGALRACLDDATPNERQELVRALVAQGGAVFHGRRVVITMSVRTSARPESARAAPALAVVQADGPGYNGATLAHLKIRVVA